MVLLEQIETLRSMNFREFTRQSVRFMQFMCSALIMWKVIMIVLGTEIPVVVVLSGSMEPGYFRGDILFLNMWDDPISSGDVVVYGSGERSIPIVHRVLRVHERASIGTPHSDLPGSMSVNKSVDGNSWINAVTMQTKSLIGLCPEKRAHDNEILLLTKGDNNRADDRGLYAPGKDYIDVEAVYGRPKGYFPKLGMLTIIFSENKLVRFAVLALIGLSALTATEEL